MASSLAKPFKYDASSLPCRSCQQSFKETDAMIPCGKRAVHAQCFYCHNCKKLFAQPSEAYPVKDLPFCLNCERIASTEHCSFCAKPITEGTMLKLKNKYKFHPGCLRCANPTCNVELTRQYRERNEEFYCVPCSSNVQLKH